MFLITTKFSPGACSGSRIVLLRTCKLECSGWRKVVGHETSILSGQRLCLSIFEIGKKIATSFCALTLRSPSPPRAWPSRADTENGLNFARLSCNACSVRSTARYCKSRWVQGGVTLCIRFTSSHTEGERGAGVWATSFLVQTEYIKLRWSPSEQSRWRNRECSSSGRRRRNNM